MKRLVSEDAAKAPGSHAHQMPCLHCELPDLLERARPPDEEMFDLIEQAFLEAQIDGLKADPAYIWLLANKYDFGPNRYPGCYPKRKRTR